MFKVPGEKVLTSSGTRNIYVRNIFTNQEIIVASIWDNYDVNWGKCSVE
jgi:hypothetical protein